MSRISRYLAALVIGVVVNTLFLAQTISQVANILGQSFTYSFSGNPYTIYAMLAWPFIVGLGYFFITSDKRLLLPLSIQVGTIGASAFIVLADSVQSSRSLIVLYSYETYLQDFFFTMGILFALCVAFGFIEVLGLRVLLGLEAREQPYTATFSVDIPLTDLTSIFDDLFQSSHTLRKRKPIIDGVSLFSRRLTTGEEISLARSA